MDEPQELAVADVARVLATAEGNNVAARA